MRNNLTIGIEKMIDAVKNMSIEDLRKICRKHVTSALRDKNSNVDSSDAPELSQVDYVREMLENYATSDFLYSDDAALVGEKVYECLNGFSGRHDTDTLSGIKSYGYSRSLKIVCSEKITEENLPLLCYILNNIPIKSNTIVKQVLYINMRQNIDLRTISKQIKNLFEYRDDGSIIYGTKNENNKFESINIVSKKQGERKLSVSKIGIDSLIDTVNIKDYQDNEDKEAAATAIQNLVEQKTVEMNLAENKKILMLGRCIDQNNGSLSIFFTNSCSKFESIIKIEVRDIMSTDDVQIDIYKKMIKFKDADLCSNPSDFGHFNSHDGYNFTKSGTLNVKYIAPKLIQYLKSIQLFSQGMEHTPLFDFGKSQRFQVNGFTLCDTIIAPEIPSTEVTSTLNDLEQKIESFYGSNMNTDKVIKIETNLSDFLKRNHSSLWRDSIQKLLIPMEVDLEMFEKIIDKHLVDRYFINGNSDYAIPSILSRDHKVVIIAAIRKNSNTILHLVRKDLEPITSNLPLAKLLDFYTGNPTDIYNYYEDDYLDPISFTDNFEINTTAYVIQTMAALKFNMAGDFVEQFKRRKHAFIERFYKFISRHFDESLPIDTSFVSAPFTNGRHIRLHRTCFTVVFEERILCVLQYMERKKREIKFNLSIRITVTTLQAPNTSDMHDVEDVIEKLRLD